MIKFLILLLLLAGCAGQQAFNLCEHEKFEAPYCEKLYTCGNIADRIACKYKELGCDVKRVIQKNLFKPHAYHACVAYKCSQAEGTCNCQEGDEWAVVSTQEL